MIISGFGKDRFDSKMEKKNMCQWLTLVPTQQLLDVSWPRGNGMNESERRDG